LRENPRITTADRTIASCAQEYASGDSHWGIASLVTIED
jgi:hypothetical protein